MVHHSWIALSLLSAPLFATASHHSEGTRMLRHRKVISRTGLNDTITKRASATYKISDQYAGSNFFGAWDFFSESDPTNGNVNYLAKPDAISKKLAYVESDGTVVMKVDDTSVVAAGANRNSVRISSSKTYNEGLFVLDVQAMPHGCGVWPAFWSVGPSWPNGGEIDIVEGVHNQQANQMTLHTAAGCTIDSSLANLQSSILSTDCNAAVNFNAGCAFLDSNTASYGAGLNAAGGGVYAMLWDDDGISIWFFPRSKIPSDLKNLKTKSATSGATANPSAWGSPKAHWASSTCSTKKFFNSHALVFDTTLCGDWAGATYASAGCPGTCADRLKDPANFKDAVWRINSVTVFTPK
ncbi:glycoside hydrolase family 16 protein [Ceratobasidium sp. AG-I]|nr:glycoside hydrolase family 16 protein [Ceratobasidium sp. AG-I]